MTQRSRFVLVVVSACLALALGACGDKKKTEKAKPVGKTTEQPVKPPEPKKLTTADYAAAIKGGWAAFNKGDMAEFGKHYADDVTFELVDSGQPPAQGRDAALAVVGAFRTAMPDLKGEQVLFLAQDNHVVTADLMTGTNSGELMGMPATNKKLSLMVLHYFELDETGKIKVERAYYDQTTMLGQLGVADMPHRAAVEPTGTSAEPVIATGSDAEKANLDMMMGVDAKMMAHDAAGAIAAFADDVTCSDFSMPEDIKGAKAMQAMFEMYTKAFPDMQMETEWTVVAGDYVARGVKMSGTNKGAIPEMGLKKATNKPVNGHFVDIGRVENGKFVQAWSFANSMALAIQLGLAEPPAPPKGG